MPEIIKYDGIFSYVDAKGNVTEMYPEVKTDTTLSVSGKAADAQAVGSNLLISASSNGTLSDGLMVNLNDKNGDDNKPRVVRAGATSSIPSDCAYGIREVLWSSPGYLICRITGHATDGSSAIWTRHYSNSWEADWRREITSATIGSQSVNYAASAGSAGSANYATSAGSADTATKTPNGISLDNVSDWASSIYAIYRKNGLIYGAQSHKIIIDWNGSEPTIDVDSGNFISALSMKGHNHDSRYIISGQSGSNYTKIDHINFINNDNDNRIIFSIRNGAASYTVPSTYFSDERVKENIEDSNVNALNMINSVKMRKFDFVDKKYGHHKDCGYVAQELIKVFPDAVVNIPQSKEATGYDSLYQVDDSKLIPYLVKAIQELSTRVITLEQK